MVRLEIGIQFKEETSEDEMNKIYNMVKRYVHLHHKNAVLDASGFD